MAKHRTSTEKAQLRVGSIFFSPYDTWFIYVTPALNLKQKFLSYFGFKKYDDFVQDIYTLERR